jgi:hypothetical protein
MVCCVTCEGAGACGVSSLGKGTGGDACKEREISEGAKVAQDIGRLIGPDEREYTAQCLFRS